MLRWDMNGLMFKYNFFDVGRSPPLNRMNSTLSKTQRKLLELPTLHCRLYNYLTD